jgi:endoplasmic reticulum-Golgi intermediate compartment protein 3
MKHLSRKMRSFDAFARMLKIQDDLQVRTASGGALSMVALLFIVMLVATETASFLTLDRTQVLSVDPGRNEKLTIHFDLDLYNVNCEIVGVDALDGTGNAQLELTNHMYKTPIDHRGNKLDQSGRNLARLQRVQAGEAAKAAAIDAMKAHGGTAIPSPSPVDIGGKPGCGSCMGAESVEGQCCNTCDQVRKAYEERGWLLVDLHGVPQCVREGKFRLTEGEFNAEEGMSLLNLTFNG